MARYIGMLASKLDAYNDSREHEEKYGEGGKVEGGSKHGNSVPARESLLRPVLPLEDRDNVPVAQASQRVGGQRAELDEDLHDVLDAAVAFLPEGKRGEAAKFLLSVYRDPELSIADTGDIQHGGQSLGNVIAILAHLFLEEPKHDVLHFFTDRYLLPGRTKEKRGRKRGKKTTLSPDEKAGESSGTAAKRARVKPGLGDLTYF